MAHSGLAAFDLPKKMPTTKNIYTSAQFQGSAAQ
jgi:hypothetical protein